MQRLVVYGNDQPEATARADDISQLRGSGVVGLVHPVQGQKTFEALPSAADAGAQFAACMTFLENWMAAPASWPGSCSSAVRRRRGRGRAAVRRPARTACPRTSRSYYLASP